MTARIGFKVIACGLVLFHELFIVRARFPPIVIRDVRNGNKAVARTMDQVFEGGNNAKHGEAKDPNDDHENDPKIPVLAVLKEEITTDGCRGFGNDDDKIADPFWSSAIEAVDSKVFATGEFDGNA